MKARLPTFLLTLVLLALFSPAVPCRADTPASKTDPKIEALIDQLTQISQPGVGYSGDDTYGGFIPLSGQVSFQGGILGNPPPTISPTFQKIVRMGAAALPALIAHLTDARPTKVVITHGSPIGSMWVAAEYDPRYHLPSNDWQDDFDPANYNPNNNDPKGPFHYEGGFNESQDYTVRVGDLCYGAIGQIINRELTPIRYQMTACIVINSPVFKPKLAEETKKDWEGITAEQLKQSLVADATAYDTTRQAGALTRLCYYYPNAGVPLAAKLLQRPVYNEDIVFDFIDNTLVQTIEFQPSDIKNASKIAAVLKTPHTALLRHLDALNKFSFGNVSAQEVVSGTLNVLMARPDLYDRSAFSGVTLRPITLQLLAKSPNGVERTYLNRLLLEDAFAGDVSHIAHPPDLSPERFKRAYVAFGHKYGPAYSAGVKYMLYGLDARAKNSIPGAVPSSPDQFQWPVIFAALFPHFAPTTVPDTADLFDDTRLIECVEPFPSPGIDEATDHVLRTLSPTADPEGQTDPCAVACVARLNATRYTGDCARFCAKRISYLTAHQADWSPDYEIKQYEEAFTGPSAAVDLVTDAFLHKLSTTARLDGDTDYCALSCIRRLRNTCYGAYCAQFCTERIAFLKSRPPSNKEYVNFFLPLYDKFLGQMQPQKPDPKVEALIDQLARANPPVYDAEPLVGFSELVTSGAPRTVLLDNLSTPATYAPSLAGLVRLGASAIPTLLDHLTDSRPTSVCLEKVPGVGGLFFREEYDPRHGYPDQDWLWPPDGPEYPPAAWKDGAISSVNQGHDTFERYTLRVGDLCYFALGMIVNRQLFATRGVPTGNWVVNSPVYRPELALMARKDWAGVTPMALKQSLSADATSFRSDRRAGAVARLCYYFPSTGIPLAVRLLDRPLYDDHSVDDFIANVLVQSVGFRDQDIPNWRRVNQFLDSGTTPLARHYQDILSPDSDARDPGREWVPDKLNMLLARPNLYVSSLYKDVPLRPETRRLVQEKLRGCQWLYRNRLLLEDVFAGDLTRDPRTPDLSEARLLSACIEYGRRQGWTDEAGIGQELLKFPQRAISDDEDLFPSEPDAIENCQILATLFPNLDRHPTPMATDPAEDLYIVEDLAPYHSLRIEAAVDRLLRSLSPTAKIDYFSDEFAMACIACLHSTKYAPDCTRFLSKRIAYLKRRERTDRQDASYYLPQYQKLLSGLHRSGTANRQKPTQKS